jgi:hypothetical protein
MVRKLSAMIISPGIRAMATRAYRIAEFDQGPPPSGEPLQLLCEDHNGTYVLPFVCEWREDAWHNLASPKGSKPLEAKVIGWRPWRF